MLRFVKWAPIILICILGPSEVPEARQSTRTFEIASIRKSLDHGQGTGRAAGDTFQMLSTPLSYLISYAYHEEILHDDQIVGGPGWLHTDRFDITAKPLGVNLAETRLMLRGLLADRFGLVMVKEHRRGDVYVLRVARSDGRLGPDLRRVNADCVNNKSKDLREVRLTNPRPSSGTRPSFSTQCATLDNVAGYLTFEMRTPVINETGLTGRWDFVIAHSGMQPRLGPDGLPLDDRPMLLSAVQEQLGLKLERRRGLVDVWVIKSVHQPTEN